MAASVTGRIAFRRGVKIEDDAPAARDRDAPAALDVMSIPMIIAFDADGHEVAREVGVPRRRRMEQLVRQAGALAETAPGQGVA